MTLRGRTQQVQQNEGDDDLPAALLSGIRNSYKLALMLTLCGQTFEPVWTDFGAGVTRTPEWRATVNAMGEIPVLEEDGVRLTQTAPILLRLAERYGRFGGDTEREKFEPLSIRALSRAARRY